MGLIKTSLSKFSKEYSLRFDYNYIKSNPLIDTNEYNYKELFDIITPEKIDVSSLDDFEYAEIGNVQSGGGVLPVKLSFSKRTDENATLLKKIEKGDIFLPQEGDILLAKIRPYLNKNVLVGKEHIYFTTAFIQIRPKINSVILYNLIRSLFFEKINSVSRCGKGYPTLNEMDLKTIHFPKQVIDSVVNKTDMLINEINGIEQEIAALKSSKTPHVDIINDVFGQEFGFDWQKFESLKREKIYSLKLEKFSNNIDCRLGCRFHHPAAKFVMDFLCQKTNKRLKDFCAVPICLGTSISPNQFDENGDYYYISMATIKNYFFDSNEAKSVSEEYVKENLDKKVEKNDIIVSRSGVAIGKFAIINDDVNGIFADFTMRIRINKDLMMPEFAYYYFRSFYFQTLIHSNKKGLQNQNIFPSQIQEFPIPDYSFDKQQEIVSEIESRINAQKDIDKKIAEKRQKIRALIENAIKDNC